MANSRYDQNGNPEQRRADQERYGQSRGGSEGRQGEHGHGAYQQRGQQEHDSYSSNRGGPGGQQNDQQREGRQWGNDQYGRAGGYGEEEAMGGQDNRGGQYGQGHGGRDDQDYSRQGGGYLGSRAALGGYMGGGLGQQGAFPSQQTMGQRDRDQGYGRGGSDQGAGRGGQGSGYAGYGYGGQDHGGGRGRHSGEDRGFLQRAGEEISSWFEGDENRGHRGKGPQGYSRSDQRIEEDANDRLSDDPMVDASDIKVRVSEGEITLEGQVESKHVKRLAEDCVDRVSGVKHVQNNLRVKQQGTSSGGSAGQSTAGQQASGSSGPSGTAGGTDKSSTSAMAGKKDN